MSAIWCARATSSTSPGLPGHHRLDAVLEAALNNEADRLHAIDDPARAVQAVTEFFDALEDVPARVTEPRHLAIQLYEELGSYQKVADATGLSKTRVGVLYREDQRRGL